MKKLQLSTDQFFDLTLDPLRRSILSRLAQRPATAIELAETLDVSIEKVRYQLKRLTSAGLLRVSDERHRRGTMERVYLSDIRSQVTDYGKMARPSPEKLQQFAEVCFSMVFKEAIDATRDGAFHERDDFSVSRLPLRVDQQGFDEVSAILRRLMDALLELREESLVRIAEGAEAKSGLSAQLFFRRPD